MEIVLELRYYTFYVWLSLVAKVPIYVFQENNNNKRFFFEKPIFSI